MAQFYRCAWCESFSGVVTRQDVEDHLNECVGYKGTVDVPRAKKKTADEIKVEKEATEEQQKWREEDERKKEISGGKNYLCDKCGEVLQHGTPVEILKHRRLCVGRA